MSQVYDLVVIGGGPAGYVGAIKSAQNGMKTALIEKEHLGGTCLNVGCIPTKALFQSSELCEEIKKANEFGIIADFKNIDYSKVIKRKAKIVKSLVKGVGYLLQKNNVDVFTGTADFTGVKKVRIKESGKEIEGKNILIATGSENAVPPIAGSKGNNVIDSTKLLSMEKLPESLAIIGGGVIGCEFANIMSSFGVTVTIVEMLPNLLGKTDIECSGFLADEFKKKGINILFDTKVQEIKDSGNSKKLLLCIQDGKTVKLESEYILIATGRKPVTSELNLSKTGVKTENGWISVNGSMETSIKGIYAAGDVTGKSFLAHTAYEEGVVAIANICSNSREMEYKSIPSAVFTDLEVSSCGMTEHEARKNGYDVLIGKFNLASNGKALTMGKPGGFVKVVSEKENHEILGVHMVGPCASEIVTIAATLLSMEATLEDVELTVYPHPSVSEALREACLDALGSAIHK